MISPVAVVANAKK